jgi:glycerol-3-phosphate acyltransferase PlsY
MHKIFKQYNVKGIGTFINVLYLTAPILGIAMYFVNAMTFYTVAQSYIHKYASWVNLAVFLILLVCAMLVLVFIFYKFVYPSYYAFLNKQTYIHENPIQRDLKAIKEKLGIKDDNIANSTKS